jgi:anionic cell wall polymer biosynthesis LytR-Cps2A-Psr (LCP) family protein
VVAAIEGGAALNKGSDGRLTFLLLASDSRVSSVSRTDTMMIISIKGNTITAASIPRDTARLPRPASMGGGVFPGKANTVLRQLLSGTTLDGALSKFEIVFEDLLRIEIDFRAIIWFNGFTTLVDKVDPITVNVTREIRDGKLGEDPDGPAGVYFPKRAGYAIYAWDPLPNPYCNGSWKDDTSPPIDAKFMCHRALPYMRSRKGPNNSDWVRARRQQEFVVATIKAVAQSELSGLVTTAQSEGLGRWWTNYPISLTSAMDLYNEFQGASLGKHVVFKPTTYATRIPGSAGYELKVPAVRAWAAQYLK